MEQVRCTNCGSTAIVPDGSGEFCKCDACGSTFNVAHAAAFSKVQLDHTQDIRAWREYLAKQLKLQQESTKARDYSGVKLFAQKILSVLPDDFCAQYYLALADRYGDNDVAFTRFLEHASFDGVTPDERREVADSLIATVEPKYADAVKAFIERIYPDTYRNYNDAIDAGVKKYIQQLRNAKVSERDVFICHRTTAPDQDIADAICTRLEDRGMRCWIAPRNILAGSQNYERDILKGVENCKIFLLVSSFKSIYSEDCEMELKAAVLADKALYSYRIDDTPYDGAFEKAFTSVQWLDATDDPFAHLEQLVIDIKGILARDEREKAELEEKRLAARERERLEAEESRRREQERIDRLEKLVAGGATTTATVSTIRSRLKRAELELQSGNFKRAEDVIDEVLDADPENGLAWWLMMLCDYKVKSDDEVLKLNTDFTVNRYYSNAERLADPATKRRIDKVLDEYKSGVIKAVNEMLDKAERAFVAEDFDGLKDALAECAKAFENEDGLIFKLYPDLASKYYWLKLWSKYSQTPLTCVEDITRESEFDKAVRYSSPAQAQEYGRSRETVSQNAQLFLRERSKNYANDNKLIDYLADNKNILPSEVYKHYSSMMYFRKMLKQINKTEEQLVLSTADISTNEYFMLAQSAGTDEQKREYEQLLDTLERNRANKLRADESARAAAQQAAQRRQTTAKNTSIAKIVLVSVFAAISYILFFIGLTLVLAEPYDCPSVLIASAVFRIVSDSISMSIKNEKWSILNIFNIVASGITAPAMILAGLLGLKSAGIWSVLCWLVPAFIVSAVAISKHGKKKIK